MINADGLLSTGQGALGFNMFAYCQNDPANHYDDNGMLLNEVGDWFKKLGKSIVATILLLATPILIPLSKDTPSSKPYEEQKKEAEEKYNSDTVNINGSKPNGSINVTIVKEPTPNIKIEDSLFIKTRAEREVILDVIIASPQFDPDVFNRGKAAWMAEWTGHNKVWLIPYYGLSKYDRLKDVDLNEDELRPWDWVFY